MNIKVKFMKLENNVFMSELVYLSKNDLSKIKKQFRYDSNEEKYKKILELLVEGQKVTQKDLQLGFIGLAKQKSAIRDCGIGIKCDEERTRRESCTARKMGQAKTFTKRDPINSEIYNLLIKESEGPSYIATRTRIAICLLTVTGIRIGELLSLKVVNWKLW
jgi:integrase